MGLPLWLATTLELRAWRLLFPACSTYVLGAVVELFPSAPTRSLLMPVIALGHALGISFAMKREVELARQPPAPMSDRAPSRTGRTAWADQPRSTTRRILKLLRRGSPSWSVAEEHHRGDGSPHHHKGPAAARRLSGSPTFPG